MRNANRFKPLIQLIRDAIMALSLIGTAAHADELTLVIENITSDDGQLMIAIGPEAAFEAADGEATEPQAIQVILPARSGSVRFTTDALASGTYAAQVFHDENGNGDLDANFVGMPKEPWGFSNNARGNFGPPKFADTQFAVDGDTEIRIRVAR